MKKFISCLSALSLVLILTATCLAEGATTEVAKCKLLTWKVTPPGGPAVSYIIGTIHNLEPENFTNMDPVLKLIDSSEVFVMESDTSKAVAEASELSKYTQYPEGSDLRSDLPADLYMKTVAFMKDKFNLPEEQVKRMKPLWLSLLIQMGFEPPVAKLLDDVLKEKAKNREIKTAFLEHWLEGNKLLSLVPMDQQVRAIKESIEMPEKTVEASAKLKSAYLEGDIVKLALAAFDPESVKNYPAVTKALYPDRHAMWMPELKKHINAGGAFIAVGVGHLVGETSLLGSFKKMGYTVEKIEVK